jgi:glycine/D-amino acid oxidase-like deaminating enzyme/nitrite reductase/ring-hydroxylating ferredoxin subunit
MGSLRDVGPSIWIATSSETVYPPLEGQLRVDAAVIGGGITGLTTALLLLREGLTVAVLEADRISSSTTGYTTAKLTSLHGLTYSSIAEDHGEEAARLYGEANQAAIKKVAELASNSGINCDFERMPAYTYSEDRNRVAAIEKEVEIAQRLGLPASFVSQIDLPFEIAGAIRFDDQAMFHPRKYCLGIAELVAREGGHIFEMTWATRIVPGSPSEVETRQAKVQAEHVIQATQFPFYDPFGFFTSNFPSQSYALAIPATGQPPQGLYLSADSPTRTIRPYRDGEESYVIVGGEGHKVAKDPDTFRRYEALEQWAKRYFGGQSPRYRWSAHDYLPADGVPYIGKLAPDSNRMWVATGFKKWGLTNGTVAAMILTDSIVGKVNAWAKTFDSTRLEPEDWAGEMLERQAELAQSADDSDVAEVSAPEVGGLGKGEGGIFGSGKQKVAAYREAEDHLYTFSPVCPHMGCEVAFNKAEKTWDCRCHGSRFDRDGSVIHGPATRQLTQVRVVDTPT